MEINNILKKNNKDEMSPEKFLAIEIQESRVKTAVWQIVDNQPKIINYGSVESWRDDESLLLAVDKSLGSALKGLSSEPDKAIFGLPEAWVKGKKIALSIQPKIKDITKKLEIEAVGFVVITEAIIQQLKISEGIPPSLILLELNDTKVNVVVIKLGRVIGRQEVGRSEDLGQDVEEALARIDVKQLPSRILIINGSESDAEQQLSSYPWQEKLPFIHLPKVEQPDSQLTIQSVALAGGIEAAKSMGIKISDKKIKKDKNKSNTKHKQNSFISDDITKSSHQDQESEPDDEVKKIKDTQDRKGIKTYSSILVNKIKNFKRPSVNFSFPKTNISKTWKILAPLIILLLMGIGTLIIYMQFLTANIKVFVEPEKVTKRLTIDISDQGSGNSTLKAGQQSISLEGQGEISTTGETLIGNPAKGQVVLYNKTNSSKVIEKGAILATSNNIEYTLDEEVEIASQTASTDESEITTLVPGQSTTSVTAEQVGEEGNISSGTELSVDTYPKTSVLAKANDDFSGGYSETVKSPNQEDLDRLLKNVTEEIISQSKEKLNKTQKDGQNTVPISSPEITDAQYSVEAGDPADNLSLNLKAEFTLLTYKDEDMVNLLKNKIRDDIPPGWKLRLEDTTTEFIALNSQDNSLTADVKIEAQLTPDVPIADYQEQMKKMSARETRRLLENIAGYKRSQLIISPNLPILRRYMPPRAEKINITIEPI